jgi:hypothetical protein
MLDIRQLTCSRKSKLFIVNNKENTMGINEHIDKKIAEKKAQLKQQTKIKEQQEQNKLAGN